MQPQPKDASPADGPVSHSDLNQSPEEILEYWTSERMNKARPREIRFPEQETGRGSEGK